MPNTGERNDPFRAYNFRVVINGVPTAAGFKECRGLDTVQDIVRYREGNELNLHLRQLPGLTHNPNIVLLRGISTDLALWQWREKAMTGRIQRCLLTVSLCDDLGAQKMSWTFSNAWPVKWIGPSFDATTSQIAIEALEITHEGMTVGPAQQASGGDNQAAASGG